MVLGLSIQSFTILHVIISLIAIIAGFIAMGGMLASKRSAGWTALFLLMTVLTSVTGFLFPIHGFTPALGVGILSMVLLVIALLALYSFHLSGWWRWIYIVTAMIALYFNAFVLVIQSFQKVPALNALAPTGSEPPFVFVQGIVLVGCIVLGALVLRRFHLQPQVV
jgi:hypothetical protein